MFTSHQLQKSNIKLKTYTGLRLDWNTVLSIKGGSLSTILEKYSGVFSTGLGTLRDLKPNYLWITILGQSSVKLVQSLTVFVHKLKHRSISFYNRTSLNQSHSLTGLLQQGRGLFRYNRLPFGISSGLHLKKDKCKFMVPSIT